MPLPIVTVTRPLILNGQSNGKLPTAILQSTPGQAGGPTVRLVLPAARAWRAVEAAARAAGHILKATSLADSYRDYASQAAVFQARYTREVLAGRPYRVWQGVRWYQRPNTAVAAVPGTSNHGWGLAVDIGEERDGDSGTESIDQGTVNWLVANAGRFGFSAELESEPWHWRYYTGDAIPAAVLAFEEGDMPLTKEDLEAVRVQALVAVQEGLRTTPMAGTPDFPGRVLSHVFGDLFQFAQIDGRAALARLEAHAAEDKTRDAATLAAVQALAAAGGVDAAPIVTAIQEEAAKTRQLVDELQAEVDQLRAQLAAAAQAEADALKG